MLEDSISCSPGKDKKTSRSRRFYKKTKRKSERFLSEALSSAPCTNEDVVPCLDLLYETVLSGPSNNPANVHFENFNPFDDVQILAAADLAEPAAKNTKLNNFLSQGFVRLKELPMPAMEDDDEAPSRSRVVHRENSTHPQSVQISTVQLGTETQFGITESEFMRFCDEAEIDVESQPSDSKTPKATKSIVDAILQDFCGSPFSESPPKSIDYDATPIFRFKTKSIRTYSRQRRPRHNIGSELANVCLPDDEGNVSDSSGLSMQEDLSQTVVPQLDTVDLNNSIKVCENLLNLSSYFSQVSNQEENSPACVENQPKAYFSDIIDDIIAMRRKTCPITRSKSADEFKGFSNGESDSNDNLKNLLEEEDDVLQTIDCDSLRYETTAPKMPFTGHCTDIENVLRDVNAVINETNKLITLRSGLDYNVEDSSHENQPICDKHDDIVLSSPQNITLEDDQVFDDFELWTDTDCLLNYKTQKALPTKSSNKKRCLSPVSDTCLNAISKETKQLLNGSNRAINEWNCGEGTSHSAGPTFRKPLCSSAFQGFTTAQRNQIEISDDVRRKGDCLLSGFNKEELQQKGDNSENSTNNIRRQVKLQNDTKKPSVSRFQGFLTASRKPIAISEEAKQRAAAMLQIFEQEEKMRLEKSSETILEEQKKSVEETNANKPYFSGFQGFQTASKKTIAISEEAKQRADTILKKFAEEESEHMAKEAIDRVSEDVCESFRDHNGNSKCATKSVTDDFKIPTKQLPFSHNGLTENQSSSTDVGFVTASKKIIAISNEAKLKANEILRKFEFDEKQTKETVEGNDQEWLVNTEFFAEDFEEELEKIEKQDSFRGVRKCTQTVKNYKAEIKDSVFEGFKTASKKNIVVSEAAKRHADQLVRQINNEDLPQDFLECVQADVKDIAAIKASTSATGIEQVDKNYQVMPKTRNEPMHACEASKSVSITPNKKSVKFEEETSSTVQSPKQDVNQNELESSQTIIINKSFAEKRCGSRSQEYDTNDSPHALKRKLASDPLQTPIGVSKRRQSYTERTPLNRIENAILHSCTSLPQIKSTPKSALISRKNLLSLSKRKKFNSPSAVAEVSNLPKTPDRAQDSPADLKEFFDSVSTSTPRLTRADKSNAEDHLSTDTDFRKINWEDVNNSARACRSDANVICSIVSPTPKERIERLKMYGEPPPISPISMTKKCRPSGLRRGRSLMKP